MGKKSEKTGAQVDMRRPRASAEVILEFAQNGGNPNKGRMSPQDYDKALQQAKQGGPVPHLYQPILMDYAAGGFIAARGRGKTQPDAWKTGSLGNWNEGDVLINPRMQHCKDLRRRTIPSHLLELEGIGTLIVGEKESAFYSVNPQTTGNYRAIIDAAKHAMFKDANLDNLVGLIYDTPINESLEDGGFIVWGAYQSLDWGYLVCNGKHLTYEEIRSREDFKGVKFEILSEAIHGTPMTLDALVKVVKKRMSFASTKREGEETTAWDRFVGEDDPVVAEAAVKTNIGTLCRWSPASLGCFGLRNVQGSHPLYTTWVGEYDTLTEVVCMTIGCRLPVGLAETKWEARRRLSPETAKKEKAPRKSKESKAKKAKKSKSVKKSKKGKGKKTKKSKKTESQPEDSVVADTSVTDTSETVSVAAEENEYVSPEQVAHEESQG